MSAERAQERHREWYGDTEFHCAICGRKVNTDWERVLCACTDEPTCDECCEVAHV